MKFDKYNPQCKILCNDQGVCKKLVGSQLKQQGALYAEGALLWGGGL